MALLRVGFQAGEDLKPIHAGHHDIEQHQVGLAGLDSLQGGQAVAGRERAVTLILEFLLQIIDIERFIIYDQDGLVGHVSLPGTRPV
jgi:hypothetical protein